MPAKKEAIAMPKAALVKAASEYEISCYVGGTAWQITNRWDAASFILTPKSDFSGTTVGVFAMSTLPAALPVTVS